jgi:predicted transcriptional regulator
MDALYRLGRATVAEILEQMPAAPSYSTVRAQLRVLEEKGHVRHEDQPAQHADRSSTRRPKDGAQASSRYIFQRLAGQPDDCATGE